MCGLTLLIIELVPLSRREREREREKERKKGRKEERKEGRKKERKKKRKRKIWIERERESRTLTNIGISH